MVEGLGKASWRKRARCSALSLRNQYPVPRRSVSLLLPQGQAGRAPRKHVCRGVCQVQDVSATEGGAGCRAWAAPGQPCVRVLSPPRSGPREPPLAWPETRAWVGPGTRVPPGEVRSSPAPQGRWPERWPQTGRLKTETGHLNLELEVRSRLWPGPAPAEPCGGCSFLPACVCWRFLTVRGAPRPVDPSVRRLAGL